MSYTSGLVHNVFFVRWLDPQVGDVGAIVRQVQEARRVQDPLVYLTIAPESAPPPNDAVRKELTAAIPELLKYCTTIHMVIEGSSFRRSAIRSLSAGMFLLTGKRGKVTFHESALEALQAAAKLSASASVILEAAKARKLVT